MTHAKEELGEYGYLTMALADVFDALISKRCYKDAMPLEKAEIAVAFLAIADDIIINE